jgi:hypothetical protein
MRASRGASQGIGARAGGLMQEGGAGGCLQQRQLRVAEQSGIWSHWVAYLLE